MRAWQKILLQTGIFTSVFALGTGIGFITNYHVYEETQPTSEGHAITIVPETPREETPTEKFLSSLVNAKALEGNVDLTISTSKDETLSVISIVIFSGPINDALTLFFISSTISHN